MTTIGFFNNKGGVGKTSLVFHVAWMLAEIGLPAVVADLDPQANLTSMFLDEERLEAIWQSDPRPTLHAALAPLFNRAGGVGEPALEAIGPGLELLVGDLELSAFEDELGQAWNECLGARHEGPFRVIGAFSQLITEAMRKAGATVALVDLGPNLGALNRAALLACDHVVVPVGADLFSLQGLRNMGPVLRRWREDWQRRRANSAAGSVALPSGAMRPVGYVVMRHSVRLSRPVRAYAEWIARMPGQYRVSVLGEPGTPMVRAEDDPHCLAILRDYRSLMPLAQESRKPMFLLRAADGAFGGHQGLVADCYADFRRFTLALLRRCGLPAADLV